MATSTSISFNPARDIPSPARKVILITGANTGLGKQTALDLAKHGPAQIWMTARSADKGNAAVADVKSQSPGVSASFLELDLTSFASIKSAAKSFLATAPRLDILFLNAGILGHPAALTEDGYEVHMGTNHLGHALLLKLLAPLLIKTASETTAADVRVVSLASIGYKYAAKGIAFDTLKEIGEGITPVSRYTQSKLANLLYAQEVAKHYPQFTTVSLDPGPVATDLFSREPGDEQVRHLQTNVAPQRAGPVAEGVKNQLWAATAKGVTSGAYYEPVGVLGTESGPALDKDAAKKLWEWTEKELEGHEI
ncbi:hypothetical protein MMC10_011083 [Thelotrema lepadinum]|nr:hypothetical protein [Thelotrema lepadinum]